MLDTHQAEIWEARQMAELEQVSAQYASDGAAHTDRIFRGRSDVYGAVETARMALFEAQGLMAEIDAMLAKGGKALIQEYYSSKKPPW
jgi:hypothetical protein